ncbi:MAG: hypothetical protein LBM69_04665, partial [Lachnospiraceae bacterium]|nr:hypothetical protein [Lachnospiraceae bacterium]
MAGNRYVKQLDFYASNYIPQAEIAFERGAILLDTQFDLYKLQLKFGNVGSGIITALTVAVTCYDQMGMPIELNGNPVITVTYADVLCKPGESFGTKQLVNLPGRQVVKCELYIQRVEYQDGTAQFYTSEDHQPLPERRRLSDTITPEVLAASGVSAFADFYPIQLSDEKYLCACGGIVGNGVCPNCSKDITYILDVVSEQSFTAISNQIEAKKAETKRLEEERRIAEQKEREQAQEAARIAQAQEMERTYQEVSSQYEKATSLQDISKLIEKLTKLGEYQDAKQICEILESKRVLIRKEQKRKAIKWSIWAGSILAIFVIGWVGAVRFWGRVPGQRRATEDILASSELSSFSTGKLTEGEMTSSTSDGGYDTSDYQMLPYQSITYERSFEVEYDTYRALVVGYVSYHKKDAGPFSFQKYEYVDAGIVGQVHYTPKIPVTDEDILYALKDGIYTDPDGNDVSFSEEELVVEVLEQTKKEEDADPLRESYHVKAYIATNDMTFEVDKDLHFYFAQKAEPTWIA